MMSEEEQRKVFAASVTALRDLAESKGVAYSELVNCLIQFRCIQGGSSPFNPITQRFTRLIAHILAIVCKEQNINHQELTDDADRIMGAVLREFVKGVRP